MKAAKHSINQRTQYKGHSDVTMVGNPTREQQRQTAQAIKIFEGTFEEGNETIPPHTK